MAGHMSSSAKELVKSGCKRLLVEDRLSTLPPEIRSKILSLLPTIDAARVGLLSKLLRSTCYSLSRLSFDYIQFPETENKLLSFVNLIDQTIDNHDESDVTTFELWHWPLCCKAPPIKSLWIRFAIMHRVEKLVLYGKIDEMNLPDHLFTCQTLVKLELAIRGLVLTSENLALPNLRKLKLKFLTLAELALGSDLFPNLPALRKLSMFYCALESCGDISISSEKLEEFIMCSPWINDCALKIQSPCLSSFIYIKDEEHIDLDVHPSGLQFVINGTDAPVVSGSINELSPSLIKVTKDLFKIAYFSLNHWLIEYLSRIHDMLKPALPSQFHCTFVLDIEIWPIMDHLTASILLVSRCPLLQELNLELKTPQRRALQLLSEDSLVEYAIEGGLCSAVSVSITNFGGDETEMMLVRFLLANMIKLRQMRILMGDFAENDRGLMIFEILRYERASEFANVVFN